MNTYIEAFDFVDEGTLWFIGIGLFILFCFGVWVAIKQWKLYVAETREPQSPFNELIEPPVLNEPVIVTPYPVGISTEEFNQIDKQEVQQVQELIAEVTPFPMPKDVVEPQTLEGPFANWADLVSFLQISKCQAAVNLDGNVVQGGFGPALEYVTGEDTLIRRKVA